MPDRDIGTSLYPPNRGIALRNVRSQTLLLAFRQLGFVRGDVSRSKNGDVKIVDGESEIDEFERDDTVYLMALDDDGRLVGSVRLLTTPDDHMLSGPFKSMFPDTFVVMRSPN